MTKRDWLSVGLKTLGLWLGGYAVMHFLLLLPFAFATPRIDFGMWSWFISCGISVSGCLILLIRGEAIAARLIQDDEPEDMPRAHDRRKSAFLLALKIYGATEIVSGASYVAETIVNYMWPLPNFGVADPMSVDWRMVFMYGFLSLLHLAVGSYLMFGGKFLANLAYGTLLIAGKEPPPEKQILGIGDPREIFSLALRIIGVVFIVWWLSGFVKDLTRWFLHSKADEVYRRPFDWLSFKATITQSVFIVAVSLYFITGAHKLVDLIFREKPAEKDGAPEEGNS